jgi:hypothetical protein
VSDLLELSDNDRVGGGSSVEACDGVERSIGIIMGYIPPWGFGDQEGEDDDGDDEHCLEGDGNSPSFGA